MKGVFSLLLGIVLLNSTPALARSQSPAVLEQMPVEEVQKIRESAEVLAKAFGITDTSRIQGTQSKTFADVGDKALDMIKGMVVSLSQTLEKVAPHVWRIMLRQQYAKAVAILVAPFGAMIIIVLYAWISGRLWQYDPEEGYWYDEDPTNRAWRGFCTRIIPMIAGVIAAMAAVASMRDASLFLINPEYYAIRDLLLMILSPGSIK